MLRSQRVVDREWVYDRLVCEFGHWDICLTGLVLEDGAKRWVELIGDEQGSETYSVTEIDWDGKCEEYLHDYRVAYAHWLYTDGCRLVTYGGWDLSWFSDKWQHKNPIMAAVRDRT